MGMDINGGIIVGACGEDLEVPEDYVSEYTPDEDLLLDEWAEEVGLDYFSERYDADDDERVYGFILKNGWKEEELDEFLSIVRQKMAEFKELSGVEAKLFGMQDVY